MVIHTIMESKENILDLFFNYPTKHWHFGEVFKEGNLSRAQTNEWLRKLIYEKFVNKIKKRGVKSYYISNYNNLNYKNKKRISALNKLYKIGLLNHLCSLKKAKIIILFGSFSRSDWYKNSDIDIFIYGDSEGLNIWRYEIKLNKDIQLFIFRNKYELSKLRKDLINNIIRGYIIKGDIREILNAKIS